MNINIRKAQPDDVQFVIPMIYSSGPHEFDHVLNVGNKTAQDYLSFAFPTKLGAQSHRVFTVAIINDQVVGIAGFYSGKDYLRLNLGGAWNVLRFYGFRNTVEVGQRSDQLEAIVPRPEADAGFINQVGVQEEFRGCGVGTALIQHLIEQARRKRLRKCVLDVAMTNPRAQALYERLDFKVVQENPWKYHHSKVHVPGQRRMELGL